MMNKILDQKAERIWCAGCGLYIIEQVLADVFLEAGFNRKNTVIVSGIGCSSRISGYFNLDGVHTTHGRAIPVAEGIKRSNPKLNVIVISGDGDLLGIGLNHLVHNARRNTDIKVFCNHNEIYGMTGGQLSPTTPIGSITKTTREGSEISPVNSESLIIGNNHYFYARTAITELKHLKESITKSLCWKGFSFVDIYSICHTNYGRLQGTPTPALMLKKMKERKFDFKIIYK